MKVDPKKIEVVTKWHRPHSWSFAITCIFSLRYYSLVAPLTCLASKTKFIWIEDCDVAFENVEFALHMRQF